MEFTGERMIPGLPGGEHLYQEHMIRYMFASRFTQDKLVLDAGCGTGYGTAYLASKGVRYAIGVDISPEAIEYSQTQYGQGRLSFVVMDCIETAFRDEIFDVVLSFELVEHLQNPAAHLAEARRVLKPGGLYIASTPNRETYSPHSEGPWNPFHFREFSVEEFRQILAEHFEDIELYGQYLVQAFSISEAGIGALGEQEHATVDLIPSHLQSGAEEIEKSSYLIALCRKGGAATPAPTGSVREYEAKRVGVERSIYLAKTSMRAPHISDDQFAALEQEKHALQAMVAQQREELDNFYGLHKGKFVRLGVFLQEAAWNILRRVPKPLASLWARLGGSKSEAPEH